MLCRIVIAAFAILYGLALLVFLTGTFGWFSQPTSPLSPVYLIPLGLPWVFLADVVADSLGPVVGVLAPAVNLAILIAICRRGRRSKI